MYQSIDRYGRNAPSTPYAVLSGPRVSHSSSCDFVSVSISSRGLVLTQCVLVVDAGATTEGI